MVDKKKNVLAVGAHPDDIELGCGGTIAKHLSNGDEVFVIIMTNGEQGNHNPKMEEAISSLKELGIKNENIFFGNFPDTSIPVDKNSINFVENIMDKYNIERVYTHSPNDRHQDHRACSNIVSAAARPHVNKKTKEILLFQGPSTKVHFEPHYFIEINNDQMMKKINALNKFKTQIEKGIVKIRMIKALAEFHGSNHNTMYAEAFEINHMFRRNDEI
ncbi:MAG: PIG-L deacetylase family protein [Candidatus Pacearchaeota archaeon]